MNGSGRVEVNDRQSLLNPTTVDRIEVPRSEEEVAELIVGAVRENRPVCIAGGRHAMGGQQFLEDGLLIDTRGLGRVLDFDRERGLVEVEAGIQWPELIGHLHREQAPDGPAWAIRQKQTGVDRVTIGGSLAANAHGRGLRFPPLVSDLESFVIVDADGETRRCSRTENAELFSLAAGGYGLFGVTTRVTLRLARRSKVRRVVSIIPVRDLMERFHERLEQGYTYGDCQYSVDLGTEAGAHPGLFSCYQEVEPDRALSDGQGGLTTEDWGRLYRLVRRDKAGAFQAYSTHYLGSSGRVFWSDTHQLSSVAEGYASVVDAEDGTEMITEICVPRDHLVAYLAAARADAIQHRMDVTYGTIRLVEPDRDTYLPWATAPWACIVVNLHVHHTDEGIRKVRRDFRRLIDRAVELGGTYFLTYHRWSTRAQVEACHPRFGNFLRLKRKYDPNERFQSTWYRHHAALFEEADPGERDPDRPGGAVRPGSPQR